VLRRGSSDLPDAAPADAGTTDVNLRVVVRLVEIQRVLLKHRLDDLVRATHLYRPLRFLFFLFPAVWFARRHAATRGERLGWRWRSSGRYS